MPKILTARRREDERERARLYLKSRLMLPTIPLGMVTLLAGYADVVLMWIQDQLTPRALLGSTILFLCGAVWGWGHARYERYLLETCPEYFARKQKLLEAAKEYKRVKRDVPATGLRWRCTSWGSLPKLESACIISATWGPMQRSFSPGQATLTPRSFSGGVCLRPDRLLLPNPQEQVPGKT